MGIPQHGCQCAGARRIKSEPTAEPTAEQRADGAIKAGRWPVGQRGALVEQLKANKMKVQPAPEAQRGAPPADMQAVALRVQAAAPFQNFMTSYRERFARELMDFIDPDS